MAPFLLTERLASPGELERWRAEYRALAEDETTYLAYPRMTQIWARKP